jgi:hypothetical protein
MPRPRRGCRRAGARSSGGGGCGPVPVRRP